MKSSFSYGSHSFVWALLTIAMLLISLLILSAPSRADVRNPKQPWLDVDSKGSAVVCWDRGGWEIWFCKLDSKGNYAIGKTLVNPDVVETPTKPKVVVDAKDNIHLFYLDYTSKDGAPNRNIHYFEFSAQGKALVKNRILGKTGYAKIYDTSDIYNVLATPSGEIHLLCYVKENNSWGARYMRLDYGGNVQVNVFVPGLLGIGPIFYSSTVDMAFSMDIDSNNNLHLVSIHDYSVFNTTTLNYSEPNWTLQGDMVKVDSKDEVHIRKGNDYMKLDSNGTLVRQGSIPVMSALDGYPLIENNGRYIYLDKNGTVDSAGMLHAVYVTEETEIPGRDVIHYFTITYTKIDIANNKIFINHKIIDSDRTQQEMTPESLIAIIGVVLLSIIIIITAFKYRRKKKDGNDGRKGQKRISDKKY